MSKKTKNSLNYAATYKDVDLPEHVFIQTNGQCNRSCSFCRFGMENVSKEPNMAKEVFFKVVEDLASVDYSGRVSLFEMNEPLTDIRLPYLINYVSLKVSNCWQLIVTNGDYLTVQKSIELFESGLDYLFVSSYSEAHYKHTRGIVRRLSKKYRAKLITIPQYQYDFATDNRAGNLVNFEKLSEPLNEACGRVNNILYIKPGGEVVSCFGDYFNEQVMGNIINDGVWGSWYGDSFGNLRQKLNCGNRRDLTLCSKCNVGKGESFHTYDTVKAMSTEAEILGVVLVGGSTSTKAFLPHWTNNTFIRHIISISGIANSWSESSGLSVHNNYSLAIKDPDVDCVFIANQSSLHFNYARDALLANKHVLVDKPMAISLKEIDVLIEIATEKDLLLGGVFQWRFCDVVKQVKKYVDSGVLGSLLFINCKMHWFRDEDYYVRGRGTYDVDGGGILMKQAIHFIDLITYLGGKCLDVSGFIDKSTTEKNAVMCFQFVEGMGTLNATTLSSGDNKGIIEVVGTKYSLSFSMGSEIISWPDHLTCPTAVSQDKLLKRQVNNFLESIGDSKKLEVTAADCRHSLSIIETIYQNHGI